jgi:hypothetical protein
MPELGTALGRRRGSGTHRRSKDRPRYRVPDDWHLRLVAVRFATQLSFFAGPGKLAV